MTIKTSTGLRNAMLDTAALRDVLNLGFLDIYGGTVPATADAAIGGAVLLCRISNNGGVTGLTMDAAAVAGVLSKAPAEVWKGANVATGVATFYRHVTAADDGTDSDVQPRVQGLIATAGADMNLSDTSLTSGADQTVDFYSLALPSA